MEDYVLSIWGKKLDPNAPFAQYYKRMREPRNRKKERIEEQIKRLISEDVFPNGFRIFVHKTERENILSIMWNGLEIREKGAIGVESTLALSFDSTSEDLDGDYNFLWNMLSQESNRQYGESAIIVVLPRDNHTDKLLDRSGKYPKVPRKYIMASIISGREYVSSHYQKALDSGELNDTNSDNGTGHNKNIEER